MKNQTRLDRLHRLRNVVGLHKGQRGKPVQLNGGAWRWNMHFWKCRTRACALGSYALTPYGSRHFKWDTDSNPVLRGTKEVGALAGAEHFGISHQEAKELFIPPAYGVEDDVTPISPSAVIKHIDRIIKKYEEGVGDMQREDT